MKIFGSGLAGLGFPAPLEMTYYGSLEKSVGNFLVSLALYSNVHAGDDGSGAIGKIKILASLRKFVSRYLM
uniref:Uncharacterized protein n=1 Tax=Candidatus Kentrum sp. UNK TaxID=2126344 RepID=A0A450ZXQ8_9GAMM|nr:MAG: hypothetical protein BECKUNK1418G_GA0071005_10045 [Candidatus Kentron sp. UNK]VFK68478.1 MAG: hypothetical protein BECKUNK1418H_GA0071006_10036 [Candidatus Kentron sp. UNK]